MESKRKSTIKRQTGMSLVELMIAMLIGLLLSAAIITVYLSNKKTFWDTEAAASLQENSRFAMKLIVNDLRLAGFYGGVDHKNIERDRQADGAGDVDKNGTANDTFDALFVDPVDAKQGIESCTRNGVETEYEYERSIWIATVDEPDEDDNGDGEPDGTFDDDDLPSGLPDCLDGKDIRAFANQVGSTVLFVKHTEPQPTTTADGNKTYIISSLDNAGHIYGRNGANLEDWASESSRYPDSQAWEYRYHVYFISKGKDDVFPRLRRMSLKKNRWQVETVADGIEDMQFEIGLDTDQDGAAEKYVTPNLVGDTEWEQAVSAKVYILAQATKSDVGFDDKKNYSYAGRDYDPHSTNRHRYHRKLYETTITLFNNQMERIRGL